MTTRRGFLALFAAAVAAQLPCLAEDRVAALRRKLERGLVVNGREPEALELADIGSGMIEVVAEYPQTSSMGLSLDFSRLNGGRGLVVCGPDYVGTHLAKYPDDLTAVGGASLDSSALRFVVRA